jgi:hypothetical protein
MHKKTYGRLRDRLIEAEMALDRWDGALHLSIEGRLD